MLRKFDRTLTLQHKGFGVWGLGFGVWGLGGVAKVPVSVTSSTVLHCSIGHVDDGGRSAEPGVVDHHVDAPEPVDRCIDEALDLCLVGDVADLGVGPGAGLWPRARRPSRPGAARGSRR